MVGGERHREIFYPLVTPQMATVAGIGPSQSQKPGVSSGSPMGMHELKRLGHPLLLFQAISSELDRK